MVQTQMSNFKERCIISLSHCGCCAIFDYHMLVTVLDSHCYLFNGTLAIFIVFCFRQTYWYEGIMVGTQGVLYRSWIKFFLRYCISKLQIEIFYHGFKTLLDWFRYDHRGIPMLRRKLWDWTWWDDQKLNEMSHWISLQSIVSSINYS